MKNIKQILRWIGLLPCAIIGATLVDILVVTFCLLGDVFDGSFWLYLKHPDIIYLEHFFTPFIITAVFCGTFIYIGGYIAPKFKKLTIFILSILIIIPLVIMGFIAVIAHEWKFMTQCLFGVIVSAAIAYNWPPDQIAEHPHEAI